MILTDAQKVNLTVTFQDAAGNPATVDGVPTWVSSDPTIITLNVAADGLSADAVTTGTLGTAQVSASADADLGSGVTTITGVIDLEVQGAAAVVALVAAGAPTAK